MSQVVVAADRHKLFSSNALNDIVRRVTKKEVK